MKRMDPVHSFALSAQSNVDWHMLRLHPWFWTGRRLFIWFWQDGLPVLRHCCQVVHLLYWGRSVCNPSFYSGCRGRSRLLPAFQEARPLSTKKYEATAVWNTHIQYNSPFIFTPDSSAPTTFEFSISRRIASCPLAAYLLSLTYLSSYVFFNCQVQVVFLQGYIYDIV